MSPPAGKRHRRPSFGLAWSFVRIAPEGGELRAAALNKVAGFGDDVLQDFDELPRLHQFGRILVL